MVMDENDLLKAGLLPCDPEEDAEPMKSDVNKGTKTTDGNEADPLPLRCELPPVQPFVIDLLPESFRRWAYDIAERMQVPLGTIKTWVHRARRELVDHLRTRGVVEELRHEMH